MKKSEILDFIKSSPTLLTKREISQAFHVKGSEQRVKLKKILRELEVEGVIAKHPGGGYGVPEGLPSVCVIEVTEVDVDGDLLARPVEWDEAQRGKPPRIEVMPEKKGHPALKPKDRVLARLNRVDQNNYEAITIRRMDVEQGRVMGLIKMTKRGAVLQPADKKAKYDFEIAPGDLNGAVDGDLAAGEIQPARGLKHKKVRIVEVIGRRDDPKAISLISLNEMGLREKFPEKVIAETKGMKVPPLESREDLRRIPLITIDGADARDFDDAVFAEKTDEGFHLIVAIADVSYYVRPYTALDTEAQRRGNSTYFPDRVVPMLPEALSNDLCSLRPREDRACLAAHLWINNEGKLLRHKFVRGLMRSEARLVYEQVQHIHDVHQEASFRRKPESSSLMVQDPGLRRDDEFGLWEPVIKPLYEAYHVLDQARQKRGALDLDLPERQIIIDAKGNMTGVRQRVRVDAHKLIEEFMILANVAAAQALEARKNPCVYRVHDRPSMEKLDSAREFLESFNLSLPKGQVVQPGQLNHLLQIAGKHPYSHLISTVILRCQAQAHYSPENAGHFGLALQRYAHFTSPIRRYADLLVHRALVSAYDLGPGGIDDGEVARLEEICMNISDCERTSMEAERNAVDRFTAAFLSDRIGAEFEGRINGVTRFGLFVTLTESGADGLVPMRSLPNDFYIHDEKAHALIGRRSGRVFRLGAPVTVRLKEADGLTGSTVLELVGHAQGAEIPGMALKRRDFSGHEQPRKKGKFRGKPPKNRGKRRR